MLKLITGYACFRLNRYSVYVIASEMKTGTIELFICTSDGIVERLDALKPLPDVKLTYPCKFGALNASQRVAIRAAFAARLNELGYRDISFPVSGFQEAIN